MRSPTHTATANTAKRFAVQCGTEGDVKCRGMLKLEISGTRQTEGLDTAGGGKDLWQASGQWCAAALMMSCNLKTQNHRETCVITEHNMIPTCEALKTCYISNKLTNENGANWLNFYYIPKKDTRVVIHSNLTDSPLNPCRELHPSVLGLTIAKWSSHCQQNRNEDYYRAWGYRRNQTR